MAAAQQDDFSGGIFRGRRAPRNAVYDAVNALITDEGELARRGGSEYKSGSDAGATLLGLWDGHVFAGQRTLFWAGSTFRVLDSDDSTLVSLPNVSLLPAARAVGAGGVVVLSGGDGVNTPFPVYYAGSRKTAVYSTGTVSVTSGSKTVTGSGTTWTTNVDTGMIFQSSSVRGVVQSVTNNTSLTLKDPWSGSTAAGSSYSLSPSLGLIPSVLSDYGITSDPIFYAAVAGRLLICTKQRVFFSSPDDPFTFGTDDYHQLPLAAQIIGADATRDTALIFTTNGVWAITNMALDAVDAFGNIQHQVSHIAKDVILWGDSGIAAYRDTLVVPAIDDVYAFAPGADPVPLSAAVRPLYREYVEAGYKPGIAAVYRGHYFLPILESDNDIVDTLVCRVDRGPAWVRWANGASGRAYAARIGASARTPKLLGLDAQRVSDLTGCFDPDSTRKDDADGTDHALTVTTSDYPLGPGLQKGHCIRVRANYSLVDAASDNPTTTMQWSRGPEGSSFTTVTATRGGGESDGTEFSSWPINKAAEFIRFKWATSGAATSAVLRRIEVIFRPYGKQ